MSKMTSALSSFLAPSSDTASLPPTLSRINLVQQVEQIVEEARAARPKPAKPVSVSKKDVDFFVSHPFIYKM